MLTVKSEFSELPRLYIDVEKQTRYATSVALTSTAKDVKAAIREAMLRSFDRPTSYTLNALKVTPAKKTELVAKVGLKDSWGKGLDAGKWLGPQIHGGGRGKKRSEVSFGQAGLSGGLYMVPAGGARLDSHGNPSKGQLVKLLSYLQAFGEQGYKANSSAEKIADMAKLGKTKKGYQTIGGIQYFVSRGKGTAIKGNRSQPLDAGIWQKRGVHGSKIKPIYLFVDQPQYQPLLPFYETAESVFAERFDENYDTALEAAIRTAR